MVHDEIISAAAVSGLRTSTIIVADAVAVDRTAGITLLLRKVAQQCVHRSVVPARAVIMLDLCLLVCISLSACYSLGGWDDFFNICLNGRSRAEICNTGLWKFSRHPNYFFEWILWIGYIFIGWQAPHGPWLLLIPVILYIFLTKITGVPFVEARKLEASGEEYKKYIKQTNSFFPGSLKKLN